MTTTTPEKPPRKFPAPCWTQDETLALIAAYRERWYALRRGYLRTADWDAVAAAVADRCPGASPSKTSAQCRHKMEKLRQRYRAEKQRAVSFPGRFFSSWFFFENMNSMEIGPSSGVRSKQNADNRAESGGGLPIKGLDDRNLVESVVKMRNCESIDGNLLNPNVEPVQEGMDPGGGFRVKPSGDRNSVTLCSRARNCSNINGNYSYPNFGYRALNRYPLYLDGGSYEDAGDDTDFVGGFRVDTPINGKSVPPVFRNKKFGKIHGNYGPNFDSNSDGVDDGGEFCLKTPFDQDLIPTATGHRAKKFGMADGTLNPNFDYVDGGLCVKAPGERYSVPTGFRGKSSGKMDENSFPNLDSRVLNGFSSTSGLGLGRKSSSGGGGVKRGRDPIAEMASSIKVLGEGFVKVEKMKIEMVREIEKMRMEMEMKRNELILESQRQIVDAFLSLLVENKKNKANTTVSPDS